MSSIDYNEKIPNNVNLGEDRALKRALAYSQEREAFGKPIARHQGIGFRLADMATEIEAARHLVLHAALLKDAKKADAWKEYEIALVKIREEVV